MNSDRLLSGPRPPVYYIAVGASGSEGMSDILGLLEALPADLNGVLMVVLHRPSDELSRLQEILARVSSMPVVVPTENDHYQPGICYLGEPAGHLALAARSRVRLIQGEGDRFRNRTVDLLFHSLAHHAAERAIGIVLSGSLDDGSRGLAEIHHRGGQTMVLRADPTKVNKGMPENAVAYDGPIDFIGSITDIAHRIRRLMVRAT